MCQANSERGEARRRHLHNDDLQTKRKYSTEDEAESSRKVNLELMGRSQIAYYEKFGFRVIETKAWTSSRGDHSEDQLYLDLSQR